MRGPACAAGCVTLPTNTDTLTDLMSMCSGLTPCSAEIGITTSPNLSSTSVVLAARPRFSLARTVINKRCGYCLSSFRSAVMFFMIATMASEVRFNASRSPTPACLTVLCISCILSMTQALYQALQIKVSLGRCI